MNMLDATNKSHCDTLINGIGQTLSASSAYSRTIAGIQNDLHQPPDFRNDDAYIFEGLCKAILSTQANWDSVQKILSPLKADLHNYDIREVSQLTNDDIDRLFLKYKGHVRARFFKKELQAFPKNARVFKDLQRQGKSVGDFIESKLGKSRYDVSIKRYVRPNDDHLINAFTNTGSAYKLDRVGLAICCEFFNNIGIDEFKPDGHVITFLGRMGTTRSEDPRQIREIGITIAETLATPRKVVDSYIWHFCADGLGEICTTSNPKCGICQLSRTLCNGPKPWEKSTVKRGPFCAAQRMKNEGLTCDESFKYIRRAGAGSSFNAGQLKAIWPYL